MAAPGSGSGSGSADSADAGGLRLSVKWAGAPGEPLLIELGSDWRTVSVGDLRRHLARATQVADERMKLLGGKPVKRGVSLDDVVLGDYVKSKKAPAGTPAGFSDVGALMLMGTREEDYLPPPPSDGEMSAFSNVVNDLDGDDDDTGDGPPMWEREENILKLKRALARDPLVCVDGVHEGPRAEVKKCLVLDVDYTFFDHRSIAERPEQLQRPFLHEFLTGAYEAGFDIVLWSATSQKWIDEKMKGMGVYGNPNYKISCCLNISHMFTVYNTSNETSKTIHDVKPLEVLWQKCEGGVYTRENTIMFDDLRRNMAMNPQNGLRIRAFHTAHLNRDKDIELPRLLRYLRLIAKLDTFSELNHRRWERYVEENGGFGDVFGDLPSLSGGT